MNEYSVTSDIRTVFTKLVIKCYIYLLVTSTWTQLNVSGSAPCPRDKLTTATVGRRIYVFGGFGPTSTSQVNVYVLLRYAKDLISYQLPVNDVFTGIFWLTWRLYNGNV